MRKSAQGISPTTRFRVPTGRRVEFNDMVHGAQSFATDDIGDFILRRADGSAAFFFSNAIDDAEMGITHVLRGEDHLTNTPRQLLVLEALELRAPTYGHLSLLVGADGSPLSKRHGATSVREFRERGYLPAALSNHLFRLGHSSSENGVLTPGRHGARVHGQASRPRAGALRGVAAQCLAARGRAPHAARGERALARGRDTARHRCRTPPRIHRGHPAQRAVAVGRRALARRGVRRARRRSMRARSRACARPGAPFFRAAADAAATGGKLDAIVSAVKAATGAKGQALWKPLRLALTGTPEGPELAPLLRAMPDSTIHDRLNRFRMIRIHNSLTGEKQELKPVEPGHVRMYSCGITVYDYFHVGNARMLVVFDMVSRYLRHRGLRVTYVRNITDVDDKIINRARESGVDWRAHAAKFTAAMHEDLDALGCLRPEKEPKASEYIDEMLTMIGQLIANGYAYVASDGDVMYDVHKFAPYGKLSGKKLEDLRAGSRVEVDTAKRDPLDFVLWKSAKPGEPAWPSPWGDGRPGWHIECSAMSTKELGEHFDIHGGGLDLKFPHHENEIAQTCGATTRKFAEIWMHNGFLNIDNEKMSKSLGNFFTDARSAGEDQASRGAALLPAVEPVPRPDELFARSARAGRGGAHAPVHGAARHAGVRRRSARAHGRDGRVPRRDGRRLQHARGDRGAAGSGARDQHRTRRERRQRQAQAARRRTARARRRARISR